MSESVLILCLVVFIVFSTGVSLWFLWQLRQTAQASLNTLAEQSHATNEVKNAFSKLMLQTQRTHSLVESSAKENSSNSEALALEVRESVSMLNEALTTLQLSLSAELSSQMQEQLAKVQSQLQEELPEHLSNSVQEHIIQEFQSQFQSSFDGLQVALPDLLREDFTNIFGTELDLIQKQIDSALESIASTIQTSNSETLPQSYTELHQMIAAVQEHLELMRQIQSDAINRQGELHFAVREMVQNFGVFESFMQEVTDIPRLTENAIRKQLAEVQTMLKNQSGNVNATLETTLPEIISSETGRITRKLAAHSSEEDISKLQGMFESLAERRKKKEELLKTMSALRDTIEQQVVESKEKKDIATTNEKMRLAEDLQRLQNRLLQYDVERAQQQGGEQEIEQQKLAHREISMLETLASESLQQEEDAKKTEEKPSLLIVDDSMTNLSMLKNILNKEMFDLTLVADGNAALDIVAERPPDIILLDIILPDIDGYEVCKEIKSVPETEDIPVIFMSGMNDTDAIVKGFSSGGADYVIKPFQKEEIIARLKFHYELYNIRRNQHKYIAQVQHEREKSDHLLKSILPEAIAERLKKGEGSIADGLPNVSVMFADIVGFTKLSARVSPQELVEMLNVVFSAFDTLTQNLGLEKIKTIGDAYMVAGGLLNSRKDHLAAMAHLGLQMTEEIKRCSEFLNVDLSIRIGLHCGEATAGVIGQNKFAYDLWGDSVNTASRMESHGEPGRVHCSEAVFEALEEEFLFEKRGEIEIKGKGTMQTYFLEGVRPEAM
ncbi:MAG: response regulator [Candidatus Kapabacteria bacterium]|jgi:class 3 adenylate cyclase|nr:response regulator [Candidatus Kapabacteria bacterium]